MMERRNRLTPAMLRVLGALSERGREKFRTIALKTGLSDKTVWTALNRLIALGYVRKDEWGLYEITPKGEDLLKSKEHELLLARLTSSLTNLAALMREGTPISHDLLERLKEINERIERELERLRRGE